MNVMYTFKIYRNNELQKEFNNQESDFNAWRWLLTNQSQSTHYSLNYGGWRVEQIDEETKEITNW